MRYAHLLIRIGMVFSIVLSLWPIMIAGSSVGEITVSYSREGVVIQGDNITLPDGMGFSGNGTQQDPYILRSIWINNTDGPGIWINGSSSHIVILDSAVTYGIFNRSDGIFISNSTNITIVDTLIQNCYAGAYIDNSSSIRMIGCDMSGNRYGALLRNSPRNEITDCSMNGNTIDGLLVEDSEEAIISYCELTANSARIANDAGIRVVRSSGSVIQGCIIKMNYGAGIHLEGPMEDSIVIDCDINYNNQGLIVRSSSHLRIHGIELIINIKIMELEDLENCTFTDLSVYRNGEGMDLKGVSNCEFKRMEFEECGYGFLIERSHMNTFNNLTITGSRSFDMVLGNDADPSLSSDHNMLYGNYLQRGASNIPSVHDHGIGNIWYLNGSGNTWSGWEWNDTDDNGIGDEPFMINGTAGSEDPYPRSDVMPRIPASVGDDDQKNDEKDFAPLGILLIASLITITLLIVLIFVKRDGSEGP
jgi:parallel beta-helix repeat protein